MKPKFANFPAKTQANGQIRGMGLKAKGFGSGLGQRHFVRPQVYEFDNRNRLEEVRARKTGDVADQVTTYGYTDAGARDRQTHPNGTTVKYIYNPRHQLKEMLHKTAAGVLLLGLNYTLDASGLRTEIAETGQTTRVANYEYDAQKRLTLESVKASPTGAFIRSQVYEYDPVGNRRVETKTVGATVEAITSTYDRNDRLKTATSVNSTVTYQYDANGRLESQVTAPASGATTTVAYGWDSRDRMVSSTSTSGTQSSTTKFSYDPDGTRIGQTQNAGTPQAKTIRYLVDRNQPYAQVVEERVFAGEATAPNMGALTNIYAFGDDLLTNTSCGAASMESNCASPDLRVLHYDGLGSTRFLSNSSGATTDKYAYEAFGEVDESGSNGAFANNFKFTGEQFDSGLGFYYLRARYMNPGTGGFVSQDSYLGANSSPITQNKYIYGNSEPISHTDPSGNMSLLELSLAIEVQGALAAVITDPMVIDDKQAPEYIRHKKQFLRNPYFNVSGLLGKPDGTIVGIIFVVSATDEDRAYHDDLAQAVNRFWNAAPKLSPSKRVYKAQISIVSIPSQDGSDLGFNSIRLQEDSPESCKKNSGRAELGVVDMYHCGNKTNSSAFAHEFGHIIGFSHHQEDHPLPDLMHSVNSPGKYISWWHLKILNEAYR